MSLAPPKKVQKLQAALHAKAKGSPTYRFYALYDKVYREDILLFAYRRCKANGGAAGVEGQEFADVASYGLERWLDELAEELRSKTYGPQAVRRVLIPKPGQPGRTRPLGIPTIKDRVAQTAALLALEPIFEADLQPEQYAYRPGRGCPQGAPISALLSNLYMRRFVLGWKVLGHQQRLAARMVNYADDMVICCRGITQEAMTAMRAMMQKLKLTVNEAQTQVCRAGDESFDFLGYTIGRCYSTKTGKAYIGTRPSRKKIQRLCREISELTSRRWTLLDPAHRVAPLNGMLVGWANYFCSGPVSKAYRAVDAHARYRLGQWLCAKYKVKGQGTSRFPDEYLDQTPGLVKLQSRTRSFPWANA